MDTTKGNIRFLYIENGEVGYATVEQMRAFLGIAEPDTKPKDPAYLVLIGGQVGTRGSSKIFQARDQDCYYEITEGGYVLPRGTRTNPSPVSGGIGVPGKYTLPTGWGWNQFAGDGAYYITPNGATANPGPDWIQVKPKPDGPPKPDGSTNNRPPETNAADDLAGETGVQILNPLTS